MRKLEADSEAGPGIPAGRCGALEFNPGSLAPRGAPEQVHCAVSPRATEGAWEKSGWLLKRKLKKESSGAGEGQMVSAETQGSKNNGRLR